MSTHSITQSAAHRMTSYLTKSLCPALQIAPLFDEITISGGRQGSVVFLIRPQGNTPFIMRCIGNPDEANRLLSCFRLSAKENLPTPRLRFSATDRQQFRKFGYGVLVEELIPGEPSSQSQVTDAHREALANSLARLHSVRSEKWGQPDKLSAKSYFDVCIGKRIDHRIASLARYDENFVRSWREEIVSFIREYRKTWDHKAVFSLTHNKIQNRNVIFTPTGDANFIDLESMGFGMPGKDLAASLQFFCERADDEKKLRNTYFARMQPRDIEHFENFEPLYRVWHHLGRWARFNRKLSKLRREQPSADLSAARQSRVREQQAVWRWMERGG